MIQNGGRTHTVFTVHSVTQVTYDYIYFGSDPRVPRGTVATLDEHTFRTDTESVDGSVGELWEYPSGDLPADLLWSEDQEVTVSVKFPSQCDNVANTIVFKNLTGEITEAGMTDFHKIRLDPTRATSAKPSESTAATCWASKNIPTSLWPTPTSSRSGTPRATPGRTSTPPTATGATATTPSSASRRTDTASTTSRSARATTALAPTSSRSDSTTSAASMTRDSHTTTGSGGPKGYNKLETPADTSTNLVFFVGTHDYNRVERAELSEFLGNSWDSAPDEDWFPADLQQGEQYTIRLRNKNSLPKRFQATELKIPGIHDANGNAISATASSCAAGKKVFVTNWEAPAPESTTSPREQRVPTGPASTGSASQRKSRTDEIPTQGARQRRDRRHRRNLSRAFYN